MRQITDKSEALRIFCDASFGNDRNAENYSLSEFETGWEEEWVAFYATDNAFCAVRRYHGRYARIFDRFYVSDDVRYKSLRHQKQSLEFLVEQVRLCEEHDLIPFFSIEKQKQACVIATQTFNRYLCRDYFHVMPEKLKTTPTSLQWISIRRPYEYVPRFQ